MACLAARSPAGADDSRACSRHGGDRLPRVGTAWRGGKADHERPRAGNGGGGRTGRSGAGSRERGVPGARHDGRRPARRERRRSAEPLRLRPPRQPSDGAKRGQAGAQTGRPVRLCRLGGALAQLVDDDSRRRDGGARPPRHRAQPGSASRSAAGPRRSRHSSPGPASASRSSWRCRSPTRSTAPTSCGAS